MSLLAHRPGSTADYSPIGGIGFGAGAVVVALLLLPASTDAHTLGLSVADFDVRPGGQVAARLTFASAELLGNLVLDRDRDGIVTQDDVRGAGADLRAFLLTSVAVDADGSACAATFHDATLTEFDGLLLEANYSCPSDAAEIEVTLYYLSSPERGNPHKGIARIVAGSQSTEGLLTGQHRAIALRLPPRARPAWDKPLRAIAAATGGIVMALLVWSSRRWRVARAAWQNRQP